ncbi:hypothetical protein [Sphingobium olei]|uniref:Uncharacterized protein n=1 Tax=Sphingobium olei TaxID=420955 RepID=A0ABW3NZ36_9SPHN
MLGHSASFLTISVFGIIVVATTIMGNFGLTPSGKWSLRLAGVTLIAAGLLLA